MKEKICPVCNKVFKPEHPRSTYCSVQCRNYASNCRRDGIIDYHRTKICKKCHKEFIPKKNGWSRNYCFECVPDGAGKTGAEMRHIIKQWSLEYKGNKCQCCGYNKCSDALEFHHLNQNTKKFSLSDRNLSTGDWDAIKEELDKCILVCSNCHREIHANVRFISQLEE